MTCRGDGLRHKCGESPVSCVFSCEGLVLLVQLCNGAHSSGVYKTALRPARAEANGYKRGEHQEEDQLRDKTIKYQGYGVKSLCSVSGDSSSPALKAPSVDPTRHHLYGQLQTEDARDGRRHIAPQYSLLRQPDPTTGYLSIQGQAFHVGVAATQKSESGYK